MSLFAMLTTGIRRAVSDAVVAGLSDGIRRVMDGAAPAAGEDGEESARLLLLPWQPPAETETESETPAPTRRRRAE